ncbi:nodulin-related protein 1 [Phoenix dactylifera]|uniref:Nodulin-related protein 1 n=1 Tax=Phoenix dactylifera TaxID=42345 RepID=A0A8B7C8P6_PHODC|nr:nodulin-related protein 1 [Phoenix dactylifera]
MDLHSDKSNKPSSHSQHPKPSSSDLLSSAKVVGEAAMSTFHHETEKVNKAKVADAAADLLGAASHYGKVEETSFGKYVEKAEDYLHKYHSSNSPTGEVHSSSEAHHIHESTATTVHNSAHSTHPPTTTTMEHHSSSAHSGDEAQSEGGLGDYIKMAEGFLKKR